MDELGSIYFLAIAVIPVLFAITVHEYAHGWVANRLGDPTAREQGRLSINPLKHVDPLGTVIVPIFLFFATSYLLAKPLVFGWAKPVPVNCENLKRPRMDIGLVAIAGPTANLVMLIFWALFMKAVLILLPDAGNVGIPMVYMALAGIFINCALMILNLIPLPPLDGGQILSSLMPERLAGKFNRIAPFGLIILVVLLVTGALEMIILPMLVGTVKLIGTIFGLQSPLAMLLGMH